MLAAASPPVAVAPHKSKKLVVWRAFVTFLFPVFLFLFSFFFFKTENKYVRGNLIMFCIYEKSSKSENFQNTKKAICLVFKTR